MWNPKIIDTDKSLYLAIAEAMERDIRSGLVKPGQRMPTHRELADIIGVNVTTITRAYKEAERRGLIAGTVGRGTYVTADSGLDSSILRIEERAAKRIEMGLVLPLYCSEPELTGIIEKVARDRHINKYLRYSDPLGFPEHRETGVQWLRRFGITTSIDNLVICAGAQHAITCCLSALFGNEDRIAVDFLTYPGFKACSKRMGVKLEPIAMDEEGMIPDSLESACRRSSLKGIYLMPSVQNPTTASMSMPRREALAEIIERYNLIVIEDDIYRFTATNGLPSMSALLPQNSIYIAGLSKAFYAGLRVAYVVAPKQFRNRIAQAVVNTVWMAPPLSAAIVSECIRDGLAKRIIAAKLEENSKRFALVKEKLCNYTYAGNPSSFYIWLTLPEGWTGQELEQKAQQQGINVFSADKFAVGGEAPPAAIRVSLSGAESIAELGHGLDVLVGLLEKDIVSFESIL